MQFCIYCYTPRLRVWAREKGIQADQWSVQLYLILDGTVSIVVYKEIWSVFVRVCGTAFYVGNMGVMKYHYS